MPKEMIPAQARQTNPVYSDKPYATWLKNPSSGYFIYGGLDMWNRSMRKRINVRTKRKQNMSKHGRLVQECLERGMGPPRQMLEM